jgi:hypothetical protein
VFRSSRSAFWGPMMLGLAALATPPAAGFTFYSEKVMVRVLDRDTWKPIESVIGVAIWEVEHPPPFAMANFYRPVAVHEAVTDAEGWLEFPAWKAERAFPLSYTSSAPRIVFYREGWRPTFVANEVTMERNVTQPAVSKWHRREVLLEKARPELRMQAEDLISADTRLPRPDEDPDNPCWFEQFPRMLAALDRMDARFRKASILFRTISGGLRSREAYLVAKGCRKASDVIAEGARLLGTAD